MSTKLQYSIPLFVLVLLSSFSFSLSQRRNGHRSVDNYYGIMTRHSRTSSPSSSSPQVFNVDSFGAIADGRDDSQAFKKAWDRACSSGGESVVLVPKYKVYNLKQIKFSGPCKSHITMRIAGVIKAWPIRSAYEKDRMHWIVFEEVNNLRVEGGGTIDGNGRKWWPYSCKINKALPCKHAPTAVTFDGCSDLVVTNLLFKDAQQMHLIFQKCENVNAFKLKVTAPGNSPNTDGIHVTETQNIQIMNSVIQTGDDCISIVSGSKYVTAEDITCGPGHGISIGSLGASNSEAEVSNVFVNRARFTGTTNGVRIKTWQGGSGYAKNIVFQNMFMRNVSNPIIIDQNYCDQEEECHEQASAVQISNVRYRNIRGTSDSEVALKFECSKNYPCEGISLQNIDFSREGYGDIEASCNNVMLHRIGSVFPRCS